MPALPALTRAHVLGAEVVRHGEDARDSVGENVCHPALAFVRHDAFERDAAAADDDVYRRVDAAPVAEERAVPPEERAVGARAYVVVERGEREHFYIVDHALDALELRDAAPGVPARRGLHDLTVERHGRAVYLVREVVEDAVPRQRHQLLPNLLRELRLRPRRLFRRGRRHGRRSRQQEGRGDCQNLTLERIHLYYSSLKTVVRSRILDE